MLKLAQEDLASLCASSRSQLGPASASAGPERSRPSGFGSPCSTPSATCGRVRRRPDRQGPIPGRHRPKCRRAGMRSGGQPRRAKTGRPDLDIRGRHDCQQNRPDIISFAADRQGPQRDPGGTDQRHWPTVAPSIGYQYQYQEDIGALDASSYTAQIERLGAVIRSQPGKHQQGRIRTHTIMFQPPGAACVNRGRYPAVRGRVPGGIHRHHVDRAEQLQAARSVRDRTEAAFRLGGKTLLEVIDAERAYRDTYRTYITSQSGYWHALYRLNASVGQQVLR